MVRPSSRSSVPAQSPSRRFSGSRVLVAIAVGAAVGAVLAYVLMVLIHHTPADLDSRRLRWLFVKVTSACALAGFAIESTRQLQEQATDPLYRHAKTDRRRRVGNAKDGE
ncbi:MAG: hypothetical protein ACON4T_09180 [Synechococcus sp.]